jgi:hypothetical protein
MKLNSLKKMFNRLKVLTLSQVSKTHGCSIRTVQRQFAELAVLRSYNKSNRSQAIIALSSGFYFSL